VELGSGRATVLTVFRSRLIVLIHLSPPFSLSIIGHFRELSEIRACAGDLRSRMDPENVFGGANRRNRAIPLPGAIFSGPSIGDERHRGD
jgi:hypothetical protein